MSKESITELPERLCAGGGTEFEQRLVSAGAREQPSRALSERMAAGIGVSPPALPSFENAGPSPIAAAPTAVGLTRTLLPWLAGSVIVGGAILAGRSLTPDTKPYDSAARSAHVASPPARSASSPAEKPPTPQVTSSTSAIPTPPPPRSRASASPVDLQDQIALIDAARAAVAAGAGARALTAVRQYQAKYPQGSFRPEAAALRIEALVKLGRKAEARALAKRFTADHPGSALAERVARAAALDRR